MAVLVLGGYPVAADDYGVLGFSLQGDAELLYAQGLFDWPGTGVADDPIVIANYELGPGVGLITLEDTTLHVRVENNTLHGWAPFKGTMLLDGAKNVEVRNNTFIGETLGFESVRSSNVLLASNTFRDVSFAVHAQWGTNYTIRDNDFGPSGVRFRDLSGVLAEDNIAQSLSFLGVDDLEFTGHNVRSAGFSGDGLHIHNNTFRVVLDVDGPGGLIEDNVFDAGYHTEVPAIQLEFYTSGFTIRGNIVRNHTTAIEIHNQAYDNYIYNNWFEGGIEFRPFVGTGLVWDPPATTVGQNTFHIPPTPGTNIVGGDTVGGNYWGPGFPTPDLDGDGFGELPYPSLRPDEYPLVLPS